MPVSLLVCLDTSALRYVLTSEGPEEVQVEESYEATAAKSAATATMLELLRGDPSLALLENGEQSTALRVEYPDVECLSRNLTPLAV